jgi:hypothetical protein
VDCAGDGELHEDSELDHLVAKIQGRIDRCRALARSTRDPNVISALTEMADEGEADLARLIRSRGAPTSE